jgi:diguanylate cyclase (GGDEF)-like protein
MNQLHNALITSEKDKENLRKLSYIDSLTEISNRRHFEEYIRLHWEKINFIGEPSALFMIDIDNFKLFNDAYGHQEGDVCLKKVASAMNIELNRGNDIIFRYGGEEFSVILSDISRKDAYRIAEKLRQNIENLKILNKNSLYNKHITVSIGISYYNPGIKQTGWDKTLREADESLYKAKIRKNCCVMYDDV